jgi:putative ABC transport system permease protein
VGDETTVLTQAGAIPVTVVGIATFGTADSPGGATFALFEQSFAQEILTEPGRFDAISVVAEDGVSEEELSDRIAQALPDDIEVLTGAEITEENQDEIAEALSFFNGFMLAFAGIALFVGAFIIYNTFSILVAQRTREHALLRAVGASRRQVLGAVTLESLLTGLVASTLGLVAGVGVAAGLKALLAGFGIDLPAAGLKVEPRALMTALLVGVGITVVASFVPARRAARVPPLAAVRDVAIDRAGFSKVRLVVGLAVTGLGLAALLGGLFGESSSGLTLVGLGAQITFLGVAVLGPVLVPPVVGLISRPLPRLRGVSGELARRNALRSPKRTSATAAALMIGVGIVSFITIFAASAKASIGEIFDETFRGDLVIDTGSGFGGLSPELAKDVGALPEVDVAGGFRFAQAEIDGEATAVVGAPPSVEELFDVDVTQGSVDDLGETGLAVHVDTAESQGLAVGSEVPVRFAETGEQTFTVQAIYENDTLTGSWVVGLAALDVNVPQRLDFQVVVRFAEGVDLPQARSAVEEVAAAYPNSEVQDLTEFKAAQQDQINQLLGLIYVLLALAIFIALVGIGNTLALSIHERTRELGLLRAVGMTRSQLRSSIRWESVLIAVFGSALGLVIGLVFGWALVQALADEGFDAFRMPVDQLALVVVIAGVAGVLASIRPARRAARLDVLAAIYDE